MGRLKEYNGTIYKLYIPRLVCRELKTQLYQLATTQQLLPSRRCCRECPVLILHHIVSGVV